MSERTHQLRTLLTASSLVVAVEAYSALTARVVESEGFDVVYCGGSALSGMYYGVPDHGLITSTELVEHASRIAAAVSVPLIADADQGGDTPLNVRRTTQAFERAGVAGIHIEDMANPKHMRLSGRDPLQSIDEMRARIDAAVTGRSDDEFVIIARTDEMYDGGSLAEGIARGKAYAEAGADALMCRLPNRPNPSPVELYGQLAAEVSIPLVDVNIPINHAKAAGLALTIFTGPSVPAAALRHRELIAEIRETGGWRSYLSTAGPLSDTYRELVRSEEWLEHARTAKSFHGQLD